jgi:PAS domain S-box-containing protein
MTTIYFTWRFPVNSKSGFQQLQALIIIVDLHLQVNCAACAVTSPEPVKSFNMKNSDRKRLNTIAEFQQLNLSDNKALKDLVSLAIETCDIPNALVTIMDDHVMWVKCKSGVLKMDAIDVEDSFCKHLTKSGQVMVVEDTLIDGRFMDHPFVTGERGIRFYGGAPLITSSGCLLGSLCLLDQEPHSFSAKQTELLAILSRQVMEVMELQMGLKIIEERNSDLVIQKQKTVASERKLRAFFNSSSSCHTLIGKEMEILDFNRAMAVFINRLYHKKIKAGKNILHFISASYKLEFMQYIKSAFGGRKTNKEVLINDGEGSEWWNVSFEPVKDESGKVISVASSATNINEHKKQVAEITAQNETLLSIAYIQSHEYRKPVASILGLMELIRADKYLPGKDCLLMMECAVQELDQKIKSVINFTQDHLLAKHQPGAPVSAPL